MAGLLDFLGQSDPQQQGLLSAAAAILNASGPSPVPRSFGQVIGQGLLGYQQAAQQAQDQQMQRAMRELQMQSLQGELADKDKARKDALEAQDIVRKAYMPKATPMPAPQSADAMFRASMNGNPQPAAESSPVPAAQANDPYSQRMAMAHLYRISGNPVLMAQADKLEEQALKFRDEYSTTPQYDQRGNGFVLSKGGALKMLNGIRARDKLELANLGGREVAYNPYDLQPGQTFQRTVSPDTLANNAVTMRGQNMADARARELNAITAGNKAPTEFQGKSAAFGLRATEADKILSGLEGKYSPAAINSKNALSNVWGIGGALGAGANLLLTENGQRVEQAQRDFVNAVLRNESGAVISPSEFENAAKQYFPQPGDSQAVITQKARNRQLAIQGLQANAGRAALSAPPQQPAAGGIKFLGFE